MILVTPVPTSLNITVLPAGGFVPVFLVVFSVLTGCQSCSFAEFFCIAAWAGKPHRMSDLCDTPYLLAKHPHGNTQTVLEQVFTDGHSQGPVKIPATFSAAEIQGSRHFGQGKFFLVMIMQIPEHVSGRDYHVDADCRGISGLSDGVAAASDFSDSEAGRVHQDAYRSSPLS